MLIKVQVVQALLPVQGPAQRLPQQQVVVGGFGHASTTSAFTAGSGYSNLVTQNVAAAAVAQESKIVAATGAQTATATIAASRAWGAIVATFQDVAGTTVVALTKAAKYDTVSPKFSTLSDNFDDNSLAAKWSTDYSFDNTQIAETNQRIQITHAATAQYNALATARVYDLIASYASVKIVDVGNQSLASHEVVFAMQKDASNKLTFDITGNFIYAYKTIGGTQTQIGTSIAYSSSVHVYFRFIESGGTTNYDTSADGNTWTNRWSVTNPFNMTQLIPLLQTGCYSTEASGSYAYFDNFNISPATTTSITKSLKYSVVTSTSLTKSLKYSVRKTFSAITKSSKYTVITTPSAHGFKIANFDAGTADGFDNGASFASGGANGTAYSGSFTNGAGAGIETTKAMTTGFATGYTYLNFWVKLPVASVLLSGDASAAVITDNEGWKWTSIYYWINPASTAWQFVSIPLSKLTANGDSTPSTAGTGNGLITSTSNASKFRFWNTSSYTWLVDEVYLSNYPNYEGMPLYPTKSLKYAVKAAVPITKAVKYTIKKSIGLTKALKYTTKTVPTGITKSAKYTVKKSISITKAAKVHHKEKQYSDY
jgi:hypothetical protein